VRELPKERKPHGELQVRSHLAALMAVLPSVAKSASEWKKSKAFFTNVSRHKKANIGEKIRANQGLAMMLMHEHKIRQYIDEQQHEAGVPITAEGASGGKMVGGVVMMVNNINIIRDTHPSLSKPPPEIVATQGEEPPDGKDGDSD
jgi:hypothetical protein